MFGELLSLIDSKGIRVFSFPLFSGGVGISGENPWVAELEVRCTQLHCVDFNSARN